MSAMSEDSSLSRQPPPEGVVELSRQLRRVAKARLEAAQRALDATQASYGSFLNRRPASDRPSAPAQSPQESDNALAEDRFHDFLDTQPGIRWLRDRHAAADDES